MKFKADKDNYKLIIQEIFGKNKTENSEEECEH